MIPIDQLLQAVTTDQCYAMLVQILVALGVPANTWRQGGAYSLILRGIATLYAAFTSTIVLAIGAGFLETAQGPWLVLLAFYVFGITAPTATFATGSIQATNSGGGVYTYGIGAAQFINAVTGLAYTNSTAFTLNPGDQNINIEVVASVVGTASNAAPGTITKLGTPMLGVTITNAAAVVGSDAIDDADLRQLCSDKLGTLSNGGPRNAYRFAVNSALNGGVPVNINRVSISPYSSTGTVTIYLASPAGLPSSGDVTASTASINNLARPDGVTVVVNSVTTVPVSSTLTVWSTGAGNVTIASLTSAVQNALVTSIASYPIGGIPITGSSQGYLFNDYLLAIAKGADASIYHVSNGGSDIPLNAGEVAVLTSTVNVNIVPPS